VYPESGQRTDDEYVNDKPEIENEKISHVALVADYKKSR
jgi:hypothetical protein